MIRNIANFDGFGQQIADMMTTEHTAECMASFASKLSVHRYALLIIHHSTDEELNTRFAGLETIVSTLTSSEESEVLYSQAMGGGLPPKYMAGTLRPYFWLKANRRFVDTANFDGAPNDSGSLKNRPDSIASFVPFSPSQTGCLLMADLVQDLSTIELAAVHSFAIRLLAKVRDINKSRDLSAKLNRMQYRCLLWSACGKSSSEIANILGFSEHTVHQYLKSASEKLGAFNLAHAVAKAIQNELIDPSQIQ